MGETAFVAKPMLFVAAGFEAPLPRVLGFLEALGGSTAFANAFLFLDFALLVVFLGVGAFAAFS